MYTWSSKKNRNIAHIINPKNSRTYCKLENGSSGYYLDSFGESTNRRICTICAQLSVKQKNTDKPKKHQFRKHDFYSSRQWHRLRYEAFLKYGSRCMVCGADHTEGARIHVDHIKPISKHPELAHDINNLQILCALCNSGKGSWDETDWRNREGLTEELPDGAEEHLKSILQ